MSERKDPSQEPVRYQYMVIFPSLSGERKIRRTPNLQGRLTMGNGIEGWVCVSVRQLCAMSKRHSGKLWGKAGWLWGEGSSLRRRNHNVYIIHV